MSWAAADTCSRSKTCLGLSHFRLLVGMHDEYTMTNVICTKDTSGHDYGKQPDIVHHMQLEGTVAQTLYHLFCSVYKHIIEFHRRDIFI